MYSTNLNQKPNVVVDDYDKQDGPFVGNTDCKALSLGASSYGYGISVKIQRYITQTNNVSKWSRQSEELPLHRAIDSTIFIIAELINKGYQKGGFVAVPTQTTYPKIQGQKMNIIRPNYKGKLSEQTYDKILQADFSQLDNRLQELANLLKIMGY